MYHAITPEAVSVTLTHEGKAGRCTNAAEGLETQARAAAMVLGAEKQAANGTLPPHPEDERITIIDAMPSFIITSRTSSPNSNWETLTLSGLNSIFICEAKVFSVGSTYGINNGRISKLYIKEWCGLCCANYDRGYWDVEPAGVYKNMVDFVVNFYKKNKPLFCDL